MEIEEVIHVALSSERLSVPLAEEVMNYGISTFLENGATYSEVLLMIERAETALLRNTQQNKSWPRSLGVHSTFPEDD